MTIDNHGLLRVAAGLSSHWAILESALEPILHLRGAALDPEQAAKLPTRPTVRAAMAYPSTPANEPAAGGLVAVIPLCGMITPRGSFLSWLFGGGWGGLQGFTEAFQDALEDASVTAIVIDVDSPGGIVALVPETAAMVRAARGAKPIIAVANTLIASAAYWIAAQADEVVSTPSGRVGSIGTFIVHTDWSGFNEKQGVNPTYVSAGRYKTEGNPDEPLSDDAQAHWQQDADDLYAMFTSDVAAGRGVTVDAVQAGYGQGRVLYAARALDAGLIDRIATLDDVVEGLLGDSSASNVPFAWSEMPAVRADNPSQPKCSGCGKFIAVGQDLCDECLPDDDEEGDGEPAPDDDPDGEPDADEDDDEVEEPPTSAGSALEVAGLLL